MKTMDLWGHECLDKIVITISDYSNSFIQTLDPVNKVDFAGAPRPQNQLY